MPSKYKIAVLGMGYVGTSIGVLLSQKNKVVIYDLDKKKINLLNNSKSPINDKGVQKYLKTKNLNITATNVMIDALKDAEYAVIATPTDFDEQNNYFDTSSVDSCVKEISKINPEIQIVIKSTIPIGHTEKLRTKFNNENIIFSPEFLREGKALYDNLYPSRIIVGGSSREAKIFSDLLADCSLKKDIDILYVGSNEAESIKLFSNTYLALRVAFFNEVDNFALSKNLNTKEIIQGMSLDERIGTHYNNPSFGYGGYCLPKDTKQLLSNYESIPQAIISGIVTSNKIRKKFIANDILLNNPKSVGIFRLIMKEGSDNFRSAAIHDVVDNLVKAGIEVIIYEPLLKSKQFNNLEVVEDIKAFKERSDIVITNRNSSELSDVHNKLYTRDLFGDN
tara:strand:- start:1653 stop:2831 length:1179 start_codon:yes stop_codon:yes gene_type:complete